MGPSCFQLHHPAVIIIVNAEHSVKSISVRTGEGSRAPDLLRMGELLYHLSYAGVRASVLLCFCAYGSRGSNPADRLRLNGQCPQLCLRRCIRASGTPVPLPQVAMAEGGGIDPLPCGTPLSRRLASPSAAPSMIGVTDETRTRFLRGHNPVPRLLRPRPQWTLPGSNGRPSRCERGALPSELSVHMILVFVPLAGLEPTYP